MNRAYISVTGAYGHGTGFSSAAELLQEMDRLGIWQTVIDFSCHDHSMPRNDLLLQELETVPEAKQRIIPVIHLDTSLLHQCDSMQQTMDLLSRCRPCCVSITPKDDQYRLRDIDAVLDKLVDFVSVILIDYKQIPQDGTASDDLLYLARRFPWMNFVIRHFVNSGRPFVFDVACQADNIYADISWGHTEDFVNQASKLLGVNKLLFGQGGRAFGGASMAEVEYSNLSEEEKQDICSNNFIRLFRNPEDRAHLTKNLKAIDNKVANSFWNTFIEGKGLTNVDIYDVHTHISHKRSPKQSYSAQVANFRKYMSLFNIKMIVSTISGVPNPVLAAQEVEENMLEAGPEFKGYVYYNPNYEELCTDEFFDERFATGYYVGLKSLPHYAQTNITSPKYDRFFDYAHRHGLPILLHTGGAGGYNAPMDCAQMAARYPNAKVILGHTGLKNSGRAQCEALAKDHQYDNVYFEFCGSFQNTRKWSETLEHIDYRRVLFGTDACIHSIPWELGRLLSEDIDDERLRAILGENAKKLFQF